MKWWLYFQEWHSVPQWFVRTKFFIAMARRHDVQQRFEVRESHVSVIDFPLMRHIHPIQPESIFESVPVVPPLTSIPPICCHTATFVNQTTQQPRFRW